MKIRTRRFTSLVVAMGALVSLPAAPARAAGPVEQHCLLEVVGQAEDGRYLTGEPTCYDRLADVAERLGASVRPGASNLAVGRRIAGLASTIATHFDGAGFTGSSISVTGSVCNGGWLNLSSAWRNRISSSINHCSLVRFYNFINLGGGSEWMLMSGNLSPLNNASDSVQYGF
jgi:hypothetical protein